MESENWRCLQRQVNTRFQRDYYISRSRRAYFAAFIAAFLWAEATRYVSLPITVAAPLFFLTLMISQRPRYLIHWLFTLPRALSYGRLFAELNTDVGFSLTRRICIGIACQTEGHFSISSFVSFSFNSFLFIDHISYTRLYAYEQPLFIIVKNYR